MTTRTTDAATRRPVAGGSVTEAGSRWLWLSIPLAALGAVAAAAGILFESTYERDTENFATQAIAQDYITLFVAVPALLVLRQLAARGSLPARLFWHGAVFYFAYTYTIAAFMVRFNGLFLVYTSIVACSLYALLGSVGGIQCRADRRWFDAARWPRRGVAVLLLVIVAMFSTMWLSDIVPALIEGVVPESLAEADTPTNGIEVIDLSLLLPGAALLAYWVLRSEPRGYVLATGLLSYLALLALALVAMAIGQYNADLADNPAPAALFAVLALVVVGFLTRIAEATGPNEASRRDQPRKVT